MKTLKKKIIFSTYDDVKNPYYGGGGARAIREIAARCPEFDITIITGNYPGAVNKTEKGVHYKRIGPARLGPRLSQLLFHMILPFYVKTESFDLWIESFTPPFSTSFLQMYTKKPVIGLVHMLSAEDMVRKYLLPFQLIENRGIKTYHSFITVTETSKQKIKKLNPEAQVSVIPNGIAATNPAAATTPAENTILYIGRLEFNQKGLDLLVDAFSSIKHQTDARLVIAGSGLPKDEKKLRDKIRQLGLTDRVTLTGRVEGRRKEQLLSGCKLVVIPSRLETFGVVALEAMAYAKPVVTFDIEGLKWLPAGSALKAKPFDYKDLGTKLLKVLNNPQKSDSMATAATRSIGDYSWDQVTAKYHEVISEAL